MMTRREMMGTSLLGGAALLNSDGLWAQRLAGDATDPVSGRVERLDPALDRLIAVDARTESLVGGLVWCEGPTWVGGANGYLLYSDVKGNRIHRLSHGKDAIWQDPSGYVGPLFPTVIAEVGTNGLYATRQAVYAADSGDRCVVRYDLATKKRTVLHDRFEGKRFNSPNDLCMSPRDGSIYFTDPAYGLTGAVASRARELDFTGVFRIAADNTLSLVGKFDVPNGIGISPDGSTLYCTDKTRGWLANRLDRNGMIAETRTFIDPATAKIGGGDGLKIDAQGNMWTSIRSGTLGGVAIVAPTGVVLGRIVTNGIVSNCELGADGYLYMTCNHQIARIKVRARKLILG